MPCFLGCLALSAPRVVLVLVWLFSDYIGAAYHTKLWPFLGFFFMPLTTLGYAFAMHQGGGVLTPIGWAVVIVAAMVDLGLLKTGANARKSKEIVVRGERVG